MALEIKQQLRLTQQLIMTPQLQQALKILQMPRLELTNAIQIELRENPVLEEVLGLPEEEWEAPLGVPEESSPFSSYKEVPLEKIPWDYSTVPYYEVPQHEDEEERPSLEQTLSEPSSLTDYLVWQLRLTDLDEQERKIGMLIIGNLDEHGYLQTDLESIALECNAPLGKVELVLRKIQEFDPPGIGARDLRECLLIQVRHMGMEGSLAERIIREHLKELEGNKLHQIARSLGVTLDEVVEAVEWIRGLEPKPGRLYGSDEIQYITPDVYVFKFQDDYVIVLNDDGLPKLRLSPFYVRSLSNKDLPKEARNYIQEKMRSAIWLIKSIHQRQKTIYKVTESIMKFQRDFLDKGMDHLKPLVLKDVAADTGLSESTISRVVTNKYVHTPQGLYELKFFFNSSISKADGEAVASQSVKEQIKRLIQKEDPRSPLSDQDIVEILRKKGLTIARRTVAKYRMELGILPSNRRRKMY